MLDLQEYGATKKWVIISESSKEVENNNIARLNAYSKQYVPRRNGGATIVCKRADDVQNVQTTSRTTFLNLTPVCAYTLVCAEIKTKKETVTLRMLANVQATLVREDRFFLFGLGKK